jgi:hypothetical protein
MVLVAPANDHRHERFRMTSLLHRTSITTLDIDTRCYAARPLILLPDIYRIELEAYRRSVPLCILGRAASYTSHIKTSKQHRKTIHLVYQEIKSVTYLSAVHTKLYRYPAASQRLSSHDEPDHEPDLGTSANRRQRHFLSVLFVCDPTFSPA